MIQRIFIENFRCFEKLDLDFSNKSSILVIGKNGAGKSTLLAVFRLLQNIGMGVNRVGELNRIAERQSENPMRIEINILLTERLFSYKLYINQSLLFPEVIEESLSVDGKDLFTRDSVDIDLLNLALPIVGPSRSSGTAGEQLGAYFEIKEFRDWLARMVILAPVPAIMHGFSNELTITPLENGSNFASWLNGLLKRFPAAYSVLNKFICNVLPDYADFENRPIGESVHSIFVRFGTNGKTKSIPFKSLSDGEKCFFLCGAIVAANQFDGPLICLWDEPDNFLSLSEVGHVVMALRRSFETSGQLIITSHNPEAIRKFSDENTLCIDRPSHLDPPTAYWLNESHYTGDLIESLIRGDITNGSQ